MDASLRARAEQLVEEFAGQATTAADLNGFMQLMMKTALERMLNTEMDAHLGRNGVASVSSGAEEPATPPASAGRTRLGGAIALRGSASARVARSRERNAADP